MTGRRQRRAIRAALLALAWSVSGLWSISHVLLLHQEHGAERHVEAAAHGPALGLVASHGHAHSHPRPLPAASIGKTPKFESPALLSGSPEITGPDASLRWCAKTSSARAIARVVSAQQPRAPPLS